MPTTKPSNILVPVDDVPDLPRCWWCGEATDYVKYHDEEWGVPVTDDNRLFEKLCLEGFQSGLSWLTVLRKRDEFRRVFADFDFREVQHFGKRDVTRLLKNAGIIRHRGKIESTINNAKRAVELCEEHGSLSVYFSQWKPAKRKVLRSRDDIVPKTDESIAMSKDLKKRGWSFVGPTTCYAFMQAMGLVNDHLRTCYRWKEIEAIRRDSA